MTANIITMQYERGTDIVESVDPPKDGKKEQAKTAHAVRGTLTVHGSSFDTLERLDGYVHLDQATYLCKLEESGSKQEHVGPKEWRKRRQIRPIHSKRNNRGEIAAILIHAGNRPHHFVGCIGVGVQEPNGISNSVQSMDSLFEALGGFDVGQEVYLEVKGDLPQTK